MRNTLYIFIGILFVTATAFTSHRLAKADDIIGIYWSPDKDAKVEIFKRGQKYYGKTICCKNRKDIHNPDPKLRERDVIGLEFLKDFVFDGDDEWVDGSVYDPKNGKTYDCKMWMEDGNVVMKGYIGISLIGRSAVLEKVK